MAYSLPLPLSPPPLLSYDVLIVGAGPVGLFLGCRLAQLGISFKILEKRSSHFEHSRSIGIHPPSLERLEPLGVAGEMVERGIQIKRGLGFINTSPFGMLDFSSCPKPYNFVLSLPQYETEKILEKRLCELAPGSLVRGVEVIHVQQSAECVLVEAQQYSMSDTRERLKAKIQRRTKGQRFVREPSSPTMVFQSQFVIACDGKDSKIRQLTGIPFRGGDYPDTYLMGDFADNTAFGCDAAIYLTDEGLVESFPLANGSRRWVAKTTERIRHPRVEQLATLIRERLRLELPVETNTMLSSFGIQHYLAETFVKDRVLLAGDAAHVVSPIGGQGMNLGWLDAWAAAQVLANVIVKPQNLVEHLQTYNRERRRVAKIVLRRAAFNMRMGRKTRFSTAKYVFAKVLSRGLFAKMMVNLFTMRGL
jgi:2-polyprenyl-6-methoxyphenol hydroxylase-like FAD-dependent oxidoreductase